MLQAVLLMQRAAVVVCVLIGTTTYLGKPGSIALFGNEIDYRFAPFMLINAFALIHAHRAPYELDQDNMLTMATLIGLIMAIYADVGMKSEQDPECARTNSSNSTSGEWGVLRVDFDCNDDLPLNAAVVGRASAMVLALSFMQNQDRDRIGIMAKAGLHKGEHNLLGRSNSEHDIKSSFSSRDADGEDRSAGLLTPSNTSTRSSCCSGFSCCQRTAVDEILDDLFSTFRQAPVAQVDIKQLAEIEGMPLPDVHLLKSAFDKVDESGDGALDGEELRKLFNAIDPTIQLAEALAWFGVSNASNDSTIKVDFRTFLQKMAEKRFLANANEELDAAWRYFTKATTDADWMPELEHSDDGMLRVNRDALQNVVLQCRQSALRRLWQRACACWGQPNSYLTQDQHDAILMVREIASQSHLSHQAARGDDSGTLQPEATDEDFLLRRDTFEMFLVRMHNINHSNGIEEADDSLRRLNTRAARQAAIVARRVVSRYTNHRQWASTPRVDEDLTSIAPLETNPEGAML
jgi:hypothetical protein